MPKTTPRYVNLRSNALVEILGEGSGSFRIATVTDDGYGRRRTVSADSFHDGFLAGDGQPHSSGYVPVNSLPGDHPHAMKTGVDRMELLDNLDRYSNEELARLIHEQQAELEKTKAVIDRAKAIAKGRRKQPGLELHGDVALVFSPNDRFSGTKAAKNLTAVELAKISILKPDPTLARKVFANNPERLALCLDKGDLKLEVREATDGDRLKILAERDAKVVGGSAGEVIESIDFPG